jgi:chromosome segregation ATPase
MGLLTVPKAGDPSAAKPMSPEETIKDLRGLLKAAEVRFAQDKDRLEKTERLAKALYRKYKTLGADLEERERRIAAQAGRLEEALAQSRRFGRAVDASARARGEAETQLARTLEDVARLQSELSAERAARTAAEEAARNLASLRTSFDEALGRLQAKAVPPTPATAPDLRQGLLEAESVRLKGELEAERAGRTEAERARQAAEVWSAGLEAQLRQRDEELKELRLKAEQNKALETTAAGLQGQVERLERESAALRTAHEQAVQVIGVAEGRAQQAAGEISRLMSELERLQRIGTKTVAAAPAEGALRDKELLREELVREQARIRSLEEALGEERAARAQADKSLLENDLRLQEAAREAERSRAEAQAAHMAAGEAERALMESNARAEHLAGELVAVRAELEATRKDINESAELESGLRVSRARAEELQQAYEVLASEISISARATGALEGRAEELSRELERLARDLEQEREGRRDAEDRARETAADLREALRRSEEAEERLAEALRRAEEAESEAAEATRRAERAKAFRAEAKSDTVTLIPELVDRPEIDDPMVETLLRFIEPE